MLEVYYGNSRLRDQAVVLASSLKAANINGKLLIGYPILGQSAAEKPVDAVLNSPDFGVVLFLFRPGAPENDRAVADEQDAYVFEAQGFLRKSPYLRTGRDLAVPVNAVTVLPVQPPEPLPTCASIADADRLRVIIEGFQRLDPTYERPLTAALQTVTTIKPAKKRSNVAHDGSRGDTMKKIEREIANLDQWQQQAAIECPDGPQRIRGLAGSGKTVVLALKAAYLLATKPDWRIAVTFYSRALQQQFKDLIRRFYYEQMSDEPDWSRVSVLHAWGSSSQPGLYSEMAQSMGFPPRTFLWARDAFGQDRAFQGVCEELFNEIEGKEMVRRYDAILIDEAQDLPAAFFRLAYGFAHEPKRISFAYDELQTLSETSMPSVVELFGTNAAGDPIVTLENPEHGPRRDIVLPKCYRNSPWALTTAHALGLGVYSDGGLVQHFDAPELWADIGYEVVQGNLGYDQDVVLQRSEEATPGFFRELLEPTDAVACYAFKTQAEQAAWVADSIKVDLTTGELDPDDILVILPDPRTAQSRADILAKQLSVRGILSHLVGVTASRDEMFTPGSVAMAHIHRSKGNEAPMVYVLNAEDGINDYRRVSSRNILFTAITRARSWVRICGVGKQMERVSAEVGRLREELYRLDFHIPSKEELEKMKRLSSDLSPKNERKIKRSQQVIQEMLDLLRDGELLREQLPEDLRRIVDVALEIEP